MSSYRLLCFSIINKTSISGLVLMLLSVLVTKQQQQQQQQIQITIKNSGQNPAKTSNRGKFSNSLICF